MTPTQGAPDAITIGADQQNPHDGENSRPVEFAVPQEDLATLLDLKDSMMRLSGVMMDQIKLLESIARKLNDSIHHARRIQLFKPEATLPIVRESNAPTVHAAGPQALLKALKDSSPVPLTTTELAERCGYSLSTVRTYLPILKEAGLVVYEYAKVFLVH